MGTALSKVLSKKLSTVKYCPPHRVHLAWWSSRTVYVPGGLEFEPQRLRGFFGFRGV